MVIRPLCIDCKNYMGGNKCKAFDKIPTEIINSNFDHRKPYFEDKNIQYEKKE